MSQITVLDQQPVRHPATYNKALFPIMSSMLWGCERLLDPMAGVGKIFKLRDYLTPPPDITAIEIEPGFARAHLEVQVGNALNLSFAENTFDAICVSPPWANRMADQFNSLDHSIRLTYFHCLGQKLAEYNGGAFQWGPKYRAFITAAWIEARRVLQPGGRFVLDIGNHIRKHQEIDVSGWMKKEMIRIGYTFVTDVSVNTRRLRFGRNHDKRIDHEFVMLFRNDK